MSANWRVEISRSSHCLLMNFPSGLSSSWVATLCFYTTRVRRRRSRSHRTGRGRWRRSRRPAAGTRPRAAGCTGSAWSAVVSRQASSMSAQRLLGHARQHLAGPAAGARALLDDERGGWSLAPTRAIVSMSSGRSVRRSMTSASMPSAGAAPRPRRGSRARHFMAETIVRSAPARATRGPADRQRRSPSISPFMRVQPLVLEEEHRVVVADRRLEQRLRVARGRRRDDLEARHADGTSSTGFCEWIAPKRPPAPIAERTTSGTLRLLVGEVPVLRRLVDDAVHRERQEVAEHDLDHRAAGRVTALPNAAPITRARRSACRTRARRRAARCRPGVTANTPPGFGDVLAEEDRRSRRARAPRRARRGWRCGTRSGRIADRAHRTRAAAAASRAPADAARNAAASAP